MPALRDYLECRHRLVLVEAALRLQAAGVSHNQSAHALGVAVVTLWSWIKKYKDGGPSALAPQWQNRARKKQSPKNPALCRLTFILRT
jgi:transposase